MAGALPALALTSGLAGAQAQLPASTQEVLLTNIAGHPASGVPGLPGVVFRPSTTGTRRMGPVAGSLNGHWVLRAQVDLASQEDEVLLVDGELWLHEGAAAPWDPGAVVANVPLGGGTNHLGRAAAAVRTSGPGGTRYWVLRRELGGGTTVIAEQAQPLAPLGTGALVLRDASIVGDGRVGFAALDLLGGAASQDAALLLGETLLVRKGDVPAGQAGGATEAWQGFEPDGFRLDHGGGHHLAWGDLTGDAAGDAVVALDNTVVLQEGQLLPGAPLPAPIAAFQGVGLGPAGQWFARGRNQDGQDWVVRNGVLVAWQGQVVSGSTSSEHWADPPGGPLFLGAAGNSLGDWVVCGCTDHVDPGRDTVVQLNGGLVVAREGDAVDLDGNGLFDDDAYLDTFGADDLLLSDDRLLWMTPGIRRAGGAKRGQVLLRLRLSGTDIGNATCVSQPNSTGATAFTKLVGSRSISNDDVTMLAFLLPPGNPAYFLAGVGGNVIPFPGGSQGTLCVTGAAARYNGPGELVVVGPSGVAAALFHPLDPKPPLPPLAPGTTLHFQCWYRDANPAPTSNFSSGYQVTFTP